MHHPNQIADERIAKDVALRTEALEVLAQRPSRLTWGHGLALGFAASALGWSTFGESPWGPRLLAVVTATALGLVVVALRECASLRRRLDAALILLRSRDQL